MNSIYIYICHLQATGTWILRWILKYKSFFVGVFFVLGVFLRESRGGNTFKRRKL